MVANKLSQRRRLFKKPGVLRKYIYGKDEERIEMEGDKGCPLFRKPESLSFEKGSVTATWIVTCTNCDADIKLCEKPD